RQPGRSRHRSDSRHQDADNRRHRPRLTSRIDAPDRSRFDQSSSIAINPSCSARASSAIFVGAMLLNGLAHP
ncbi:hypothetical protein ACIQYM_38680, partial [Rhodococcus erythropolis]